MKRNSLQVWRRCGTCGTVFSDLEELREHLEGHARSKGETLHVHRQNQTSSTDLQRQYHNPDTGLRKIVGVDR